MTSSNDQLLSLANDLVKKEIIFFDKRTQQYVLSPTVESQHFPISLGFDDIAIQQAKNICNSRLDVDTKSEVIRGVFRDIPLIAANMSTVTSPEFCIELYKLGALGCLHRAMSDADIINGTKKIANQCDIVCVSIGVGDSQFELCQSLIRIGANVIFIDIAQGYSDNVISLAKCIKEFSPQTKVVVGNAINENIMLEVHSFVDAVKVGISSGMACETKDTAGCTERQFSAILKFKRLSREFGLPVISDGGIRKPSDFVKAIAAGSNSAMAGSVFASCPESAADIVKEQGKVYKIYAGMASRYVQDRWRGGLKPGTCPEGKVIKLPYGESCELLLDRYTGALRSGITYAGADNIKDFQNKVKFVRLT